MKRIITFLSILVLATMAAGAQTIDKRSDETKTYAKNYADNRPFSKTDINDIELSNLMIQESKLLNNRKVALILSLSGTAV